MIKYDKQFLINLGNSPQAITTPAHLLINMYNNYIPDYVFLSSDHNMKIQRSPLNRMVKSKVPEIQ